MVKLSNAYVREIIFGKRRTQQYWELTTDPETLPKNATWCVMTHIENLKYDQFGNLYGRRNWVEYGLKQSKNELGWADFRVTNYAQIERWWEMVMSAYLLVSLHTNALHQPHPQLPIQRDAQPQAIVLKLAQHPGWNQANGWKQVLNNLRLVIQPSVILNLLQPWLNLFPIPRLSAGLECLVALMNRFPSRLPDEKRRNFGPALTRVIHGASRLFNTRLGQNVRVHCNPCHVPQADFHFDSA